ncbi:RRXRR domain-containing protein, partial [Rhabdochromatium marinum]|uniref:RRXRR domain-containing protein n=1 Tax=Rhabdochromatium marinum TaxID=48729 RepID=UPI0023DE8505
MWGGWVNSPIAGSDSYRLASRRACRRRRRTQNLRHRAPRFLNRTKPEGWLAPSLRHRLDTTLSWVARLQRLAP